ncbi:MAG: DUF4156 domain-containing protein [Oligoflexia bacterium]|nr:DUF4156 domain-containing protein [Oligoflexia bacterium]
MNIFLFFSCSAINLKPTAKDVFISNDNPKGCKHLGEVIGKQGDFFTGGWTSNDTLVKGAMNDLKNQAAEMGGNYIQLLSSSSGHTSGKYGGSQTDVTLMGNVFKCDKAD